MIILNGTSNRTYPNSIVVEDDAVSQSLLRVDSLYTKFVTVITSEKTKTVENSKTGKKFGI